MNTLAEAPHLAAMPKPGRTMLDYLLYSTILMVFSERFVLNLGIDWKLAYAIVFINLPIMLWFWNMEMPRRYGIFLSYLLTVGALPLLYTENTVLLYAAQMFGVGALSLYACLFFKLQDRSVGEIFEVYAGVAFWVSAWGLVQAVLMTAWMGTFQPVRSIVLEPAHFCTLVMPAFFYYAATTQRAPNRRRRMLIILLAIILSGSSTGFLGLCLTIFLLFKRKSLTLLLVPFLIGLLAVTAYVVSADVRLRVDDSYKALTGGSVADVNVSTYALLSNLYVTQQTLAKHPLLGAGMGGFVTQHKKFIEDLPGVQAFIDSEIVNLNAHDGNSLALRVATDFGGVGLLLMFLALFLLRPSSASPYAEVSNAVMLYIAMKLLREGHYFSPEMYFFLWTYALSSRLAVNPKPTRTGLLSGLLQSLDKGATAHEY